MVHRSRLPFRVHTIAVGLVFLTVVVFLYACNDDSSTSPADVTAPAAPSDFVAESDGPAAVHFQWTSTGDNGREGRASGYEIRRSMAPLTDETWDSAVLTATGHCYLPGQSQECEATGLAAGSWNFALRIEDEAGNRSPLSDVALVDVTGLAPPAAITDLGGYADSSTVILGWSAPEVSEGAATVYDLRYSTVPFTEETWDEAWRVPNLPTPAAPGWPEEVRVRGLNYVTTYYFAVRSAAAPPSWSAISNLAEVRTSRWVRWVVDGEDKASIDGFSWHPNGLDLVYSRAPYDDPLRSRLVLQRALGGERTYLTSSLPGAFRPSISPNGRYVAFVQRTTPSPTSTEFTNYALAMMELRAGAEIQIVPFRHAVDPVKPAWSPSGYDLACVTSGGGSLYVVSRFNGDSRLIYTAPDRDHIHGVSWAPGDQIAVAVDEKIVLVPPEGGEPTTLVVAEESSTYVYGPQWRNGGRYLSFGEGWNHVEESTRVRTVDATGRDVDTWIPTSRGASAHAFSPDGTMYGYVDGGLVDWLRVTGPVEPLE
ncbi:MAG: hypothetical protein KDA27_18175 [Candidatus Eisenbacteria bacterium]|uniref:Fibronectin type-III domain-containing protein n=1 Tax=Eiseniibacteriota bacterium TaxID=2212470 RepID=A0A956NEY9_UNCEI|nr:hypothetical protein [Candidatus Eisenbacteria bacterium]